MSDQDNIFGKPNAGEGKPATVSDDALGTLLAGIKNEKGEQKYSDVSTALEALATSQIYIPELQTKLDDKDSVIAELREKLTKSSAVDEVLQKLQASHQGQEDDQPKGLDAGEAAKLFESLLSKSEQQKARSENINSVTSTLQKTFGDNAEKEFYDKGKELGLDRQALNDLAGTSPAAVLALFGEKSTGTSVDVSRGSQDLSGQPQDKNKEMGRNQGKSVLMGSTARDVRAEHDIVKELVADLHDKGLSVEDLTDPKKFRQTFG